MQTGNRSMDPLSHPWNLSPANAAALQTELAARVDTRTPLDLSAIRFVGGVDVSVKAGISRAAVVVLSFPALEMVDQATASLPTSFPYIPGLLSFREGEVIFAAQKHLTLLPDVYLFDGAGIAHPRRLGIAAHLGLWWDAPTVGCAKSYLLGEFEEPGPEKGSSSILTDRGETIGVVLRTRTNVRPVYVSPGHRATVDTARDLVLRCAPRYRLPEPIRAAHHLAGEF